MRRLKLWLTVFLYRLADRLNNGLDMADAKTVYVRRNFDDDGLDELRSRFQKLVFSRYDRELPTEVSVGDHVWRRSDTIPRAVD